MNFLIVIMLACHVNLLFLMSCQCAIDANDGQPQAPDATESANVVPTDTNIDHIKAPTILIVTLFRNKAHTMPLFFTYLNQIAYPKDRISLWFRTDHNEDKTLDILYHWLLKWSNAYHNVNIEYENNTRRESETSETHWSDERYLDVIRMKEEALNHGRKIWADYVFFLDADVFLTRPSILSDLIELDVPIVAPMLLSDGLYSNFWCGLTPEYYYQRTDEYKFIYNYEHRGQFDVPMVHSAVLINLNDIRSDTLTFNKTILGERFSISEQDLALIPIDDIIIFALSANHSQLPLKITNDNLYGFVTVPLDNDEDIAKDYVQVTNTKIMILNEKDCGSIDVEPGFKRYISYPIADTMSFDRIFMINLERRPDRRDKMEQSFQELGLTVEYVAAIDGQTLSTEYLEKIGVKYLPGYADPFHNRPMTKGEIGCFLSHFWVWEKQVMENLNEVLVLEDDIRFEPFFNYFGRKRLLKQNENWVDDSEYLVYPSYSYWTLGYALSLDGAKKLLAARPLDNLIPVDEFLPIMFNQHQNETWKKAFLNRNLVAWSVAPLLLFPTHYTGEDGYISDTEQSDTINLLGEKSVVKKGNKESYNDSAIGEAANPTGDLSENANISPGNNSSIDTSFLINNVNDHAAIQHQSSSEQTTHTKL